MPDDLTPNLENEEQTEDAAASGGGQLADTAEPAASDLVTENNEPSSEEVGGDEAAEAPAAEDSTEDDSEDTVDAAALADTVDDEPASAPETESSSTGEVFLDSDEEPEPEQSADMDWYILKVAFNREDSIAEALRKKIAMEGMDEFFEDIVVPSEDVATFSRDGKKRISKRKLLPGYIMVRMAINDDTWFLVRETGGISDFTGSAGKPMPMDPADVERFINRPELDDEEEAPVKIGIPFKVGDQVRVKEGNFENQEGVVDALDEANGRITVIINIFGRSVPMELDHWQVEPV